MPWTHYPPAHGAYEVASPQPPALWRGRRSFAFRGISYLSLTVRLIWLHAFCTGVAVPNA